MGNEKPIRECIMCRGKFPKKELIRIAKNENGIFLDITHKMQGRGAYVCKNCAKSPDLLKKRVLDRALRQRVCDEIYEMLITKED